MPLRFSFRELLKVFIGLEVVEILLRIFFLPQPISLMVPGMVLVLYCNRIQKPFTTPLALLLLLPPVGLYILQALYMLLDWDMHFFRVVFVCTYVVYTCWIIVTVFLKIPFLGVSTDHKTVLIKQIALLVFMLMLIRLLLIYLDGIGFKASLLNQPNLLRITFIIALIAIKVIYLLTVPDTSPAVETPEEYETIERLRNRLEELFTKEKFFLNKKITKQKLANELGCTKSEFDYFIDTHIEGGIKNYIARHRINYALELFKTKGSLHTIEAIALESGFSSVQTFNKYFIAYIGHTPSKYFNRIKPPQICSSSLE
ncbi:helix-turn-helix domain-containing protein [Planobacterium oryzisoli]|uniref:AraC family transcriptional regulator n=1 Tax=Planobacterium oryzisoli TaxID=2771435 RepID=A0A930YW81_9FLAO|nr:helix-turn-helix domain-containing protein [Planobacterium oryzisoli]MBF5027553.1 AraC family transcriptional regulator [Planobacterium oryzisoli]